MSSGMWHIQFPRLSPTFQSNVLPLTSTVSGYMVYIPRDNNFCRMPSINNILHRQPELQTMPMYVSKDPFTCHKSYTSSKKFLKKAITVMLAKGWTTE